MSFSECISSLERVGFLFLPAIHDDDYEFIKQMERLDDFREEQKCNDIDADFWGGE